MNKKVLKTLEFDKILARLTGEADCDAAKERIRHLKPSSNRNKIIEWQAQTTAALGRILRDDKPRFHGLRDPRPSLLPLKKGSSLGIGELLSICRLLEITRDAIASDKKLSNRADESQKNSPVPHTDNTASIHNGSDVLSGMFASLVDVPELRAEINRCLPGPDEVADDASPELASIRRTIRGMDSRIREQLNKTIAESGSMLRETLVTMRGGRYCLPVRSEYKSSFPGMIHDQSSTGSTFFIEPLSVVNLNNELNGWLAREQTEIERILAGLSNLVEPYADSIENDFLLLADLDFIFAKGNLSKKMHASEPLFQGKYIQIRQGRHPLIDPKQVVPIDVSLGRDYDLLVITGPNTGGKTVTLKTVGLLTLMGQAGLHIPANDRSHLRVYDEVFADIGDEQSIEQSLSTFSSHMTNTVYILKKATDRALVLFDELGAGTDPVEGAALAIAILDHLRSRHVTAMATTHYSELKLYALQEDGVENASCEFDVNTLSPTYRLLVGIPGKSNAFAISSKLGLSGAIIKDAKRRIGDDEKSFEDVVQDLESTRLTAEREREKAVRFRENAESHKKKLEEKEERLNQSRDKILRRANEEAREILDRAKKVADESIRKYNKWMNDPEALRAMEQERSRLRDEINNVDEGLADTGIKSSKPRTPGKKPEEFNVGDVVMVHSMGVKGTISTTPVRGKCFVQIGILRTEVKIDDLEFIEAGGKQKVSEVKLAHTGSIKSSKAMNVHTEINLIGKTVGEAIPMLEKYLDDAYLAKLSSVRIIHGMGTGALRAAVHDHLKRSPIIEEYRLGEQGEGGYGATVATFKK
ncbi:MAG: endonuclease MutS2 [Eubacterium sp.]|nr:endonuclease MutS2 [Eubacterium sp.]